MRKKTQQLLKLIPLELLITAIVFLLALFAFSFLVHEAVYEQEDMLDNKAIQFFATHASPGFIAAMEKITFFGSTTFLFPAYLLLIGWHIFKKKIPYAIDIAIIAVSSTLAMFFLKQIFKRHRPALPIIKGITGYSFPSGHSLSSFVFSTILVYLVWQGSSSRLTKYLLSLIITVCPLLIGLSRVVLNVHYATDVLGGFCLAIAWVLASFVILKKIRKSGSSPSGTAVA